MGLSKKDDDNLLEWALVLSLDEKAAGLDFFGRGLNNVEHQPARKPGFFCGLEEDFGLPLVGLNRGDSERPGI